MTDTPASQTPEPKRKNRWLRPLLIVSLAINLLVVGIFAGWTFSGGKPPGDRIPPSARSVMGEPFLRALPPEQRKILLSEIVERSPNLRQNRAELRQHFEELLAALRAEPFDANEVSRLLEAQRGAALSRQDVGERLLLERLGSMSVEERDAYANRLAKSLRRLRRD